MSIPLKRQTGKDRNNYLTASTENVSKFDSIFSSKSEVASTKTNLTLCWKISKTTLIQSWIAPRYASGNIFFKVVSIVKSMMTGTFC
jgi:hypothetical protein